MGAGLVHTYGMSTGTHVRTRLLQQPKSSASWLAVLGLALGLAASGCSDQKPRYRAKFPAVPATAPRPPGKVLFVLSAAAVQVLQNGKRRPTGNFLSELYEPYLALKAAGYEVVMATPEARPPSLDPESLDAKYWADHPQHRQAARDLFASPLLAKPMGLADALASHAEFQGMLVPGGQGLMVDLLDDARVHALLERFAVSDRPLGMICHAPALLMRLQSAPALRGRQVTSVSGFEEFYIETFVMGGNARVRNIGDQLEALGYTHTSAFPGRSHAVRDCNVVTSQNPFSGGAFTRLYLDALSDFRRGARCVAAE
jgi:putative intracellular protease/amidase